MKTVEQLQKIRSFCDSSYHGALDKAITAVNTLDRILLDLESIAMQIDSEREALEDRLDDGMPDDGMPDDTDIGFNPYMGQYDDDC